MKISNCARRKVLKTKWEPRFFIIVDYHPFRTKWKFFTTRGMKRARKICKKWVRQHPWGSVSIVTPEVFRDFWKRFNKDT